MKTIKDGSAGFDVSLASEEEKREPMTFEELRKRLKHIAVLCWGLSIDLANEIQLRELLLEENKDLRERVAKFDKRASQRSERLAGLSSDERNQRELDLFIRRSRVAKSRKKKSVEAQGV